jgi:hypothetical protein
MIELRSTYNVLTSYGDYSQNHRSYTVLARNIHEAITIVEDWIFVKNLDNWKITNITLTGDILVREED